MDTILNSLLFVFLGLGQLSHYLTTTKQVISTKHHLLLFDLVSPDETVNIAFTDGSFSLITFVTLSCRLKGCTSSGFHSTFLPDSPVLVFSINPVKSIRYKIFCKVGPPDPSVDNSYIFNLRSVKTCDLNFTLFTLFKIRL